MWAVWTLLVLALTTLDTHTLHTDPTSKEERPRAGTNQGVAGPPRDSSALAAQYAAESGEKSPRLVPASTFVANESTTSSDSGLRDVSRSDPLRGGTDQAAVKEHQASRAATVRRRRPRSVSQALAEPQPPGYTQARAEPQPPSYTIPLPCYARLLPSNLVNTGCESVARAWSCQGFCGDFRRYPCSCHRNCFIYQTCCPDFNAVCFSSSGPGLPPLLLSLLESPPSSSTSSSSPEDGVTHGLGLLLPPLKTENGDVGVVGTLPLLESSQPLLSTPQSVRQAPNFLLFPSVSPALNDTNGVSETGHLTLTPAGDKLSPNNTLPATGLLFPWKESGTLEAEPNQPSAAHVPEDLFSLAKPGSSDITNLEKSTQIPGALLPTTASLFLKSEHEHSEINSVHPELFSAFSSTVSESDLRIAQSLEPETARNGLLRTLQTPALSVSTSSSLDSTSLPTTTEKPDAETVFPSLNVGPKMSRPANRPVAPTMEKSNVLSQSDAVVVENKTHNSLKTGLQVPSQPIRNSTEPVDRFINDPSIVPMSMPQVPTQAHEKMAQKKQLSQTVATAENTEFLFPDGSVHTEQKNAHYSKLRQRRSSPLSIVAECVKYVNALLVTETPSQSEKTVKCHSDEQAASIADIMPVTDPLLGIHFKNIHCLRSSIQAEEFKEQQPLFWQAEVKISREVKLNEETFLKDLVTSIANSSVQVTWKSPAGHDHHLCDQLHSHPDLPSATCPFCTQDNSDTADIVRLCQNSTRSYVVEARSGVIYANKNCLYCTLAHLAYELYLQLPEAVSNITLVMEAFIQSAQCEIPLPIIAPPPPTATSIEYDHFAVRWDPDRSGWLVENSNATFSPQLYGLERTKWVQMFCNDTDCVHLSCVDFFYLENGLCRRTFTPQTWAVYLCIKADARANNCSTNVLDFAMGGSRVNTPALIKLTVQKRLENDFPGKFSAGQMFNTASIRPLTSGRGILVEVTSAFYKNETETPPGHGATKPVTRALAEELNAFLNGSVEVCLYEQEYRAEGKVLDDFLCTSVEVVKSEVSAGSRGCAQTCLSVSLGVALAVLACLPT